AASAVDVKLRLDHLVRRTSCAQNNRQIQLFRQPHSGASAAYAEGVRAAVRAGSLGCSRRRIAALLLQAVSRGDGDDADGFHYPLPLADSEAMAAGTANSLHRPNCNGGWVSKRKLLQ